MLLRSITPLASLLLPLSYLTPKTNAFTSTPTFATRWNGETSPITSTISHSSTPTQLHTSTSSSSPSIPLSPLISSIKISKTVEIFSLVKQMQSEGQSVTSLCVGEPDFPPPPAILAAAQAAISNHKTTYTAVSGIIELRRAIANDLRSRKNTAYDPLTEILLSNGAKQSVYQGIAALCGPGDTVLIPAPYWPSYPEMVTLCGATSRIVDTAADDYLLTGDALRRELEACPSIKMIVLCNPSNPSGAVHSRAVLEDLAGVLRDYPNVFILADEIYERLVYDVEHVSVASLPGMKERTITINGFSKAYAMTGLRLGYSCAPKEITAACTTIQSQITSCAGSVSQWAGLAALEDVKEEEMEENVKLMKEKRDFVLGELEGMGFTFDKIPEGAFYVLLDVSDYCDNDDNTFCVNLLKEKKLALVPGSSFGVDGTVRISYATSLEELGVAMDKLREFLMDIKKGE